MIGAIEAGGTKIVCAVGRTWREVRDAEKFIVPTTSPEETMRRVMEWFVASDHESPIASMGVASFGPIDFTSNSIAMSTPKESWRGVNWSDAIGQYLTNVRLGFDTDTDAAGLAEWRWGASVGRAVSVYVTVGTGIGGALIIDGTPVHGLLHPEFGHMVVPRQPGDDFPGTCPAHGDCLEGLACGLAVKQRWHQSGPQFPRDHPAWELESDYLSSAMVNIITITSPEIIVLGGGIMSVDGLLDKVRVKTRARLAGYIAKEQVTTQISDYIVSPGLGNSSGVVGAFALGERALHLAHLR